MWAREGSAKSEDEQEAILAAAPGIDAPSMQALLDQLGIGGTALEGSMLTVQSRLHAAWEALSLPEGLRKPYRWQAGEVLDEAMLEK